MLKKALVATTFLFAVNAVALAADILPTKKGLPATPILTWTGFYGGMNSGVAFGDATFSDPFAPSIFGDRVSTPGYLWGVQAGYNWQAPGSSLVVGVEADADLVASDGVNTCFAASPYYVPSRCHVRPDFSGTLTGRIGYALGETGRTLVYVKGGLAAIDEHIDATVSGAGGLPVNATTQDATRVGWTLGIGLEYALTGAWSLGAEYDYLNFGRFNSAAPPSYVQIAPPTNAYVAVAGGTSRVSQDVSEFKVSLNYHLGGALPGDSSLVPGLLPLTLTSPNSDWAFEAGSRYWYSVGKFQKGLYPPSQISQLTYADMATNSGEVFGRVESPWNVFLKGYAGLGGIGGGHMNDEDFLIFSGTVPYSNTLSSTKGTLGYAVVDLGYDWLRSPNFKVGSFVGYFYDHEQMKAYGCTQISNPNSDCVPALPSSTLGIVETDDWQALRLGTSAEAMLTDRLKLSADVAYLPYVSLRGNDQHLLRGIVFPESGNGRGVQAEAIVSYDVTKNWDVGVGARYWSAWTDHASYSYPGGSGPAEYRLERYGAFLQTSYKF